MQVSAFYADKAKGLLQHYLKLAIPDLSADMLEEIELIVDCIIAAAVNRVLETTTAEKGAADEVD